METIDTDNNTQNIDTDKNERLNNAQQLFFAPSTLSNFINFNSFNTLVI